MDKPKRSPDLAILIGHALAKKGKAKHDPLDEQASEEPEDGSHDKDEHMTEIAEELLQAFEDKNSGAIKDLLMEAFECMSAKDKY